MLFRLPSQPPQLQPSLECSACLSELQCVEMNSPLRLQFDLQFQHAPVLGCQTLGQLPCRLPPRRFQLLPGTRRRLQHPLTGKLHRRRHRHDRLVSDPQKLLQSLDHRRPQPQPDRFARHLGQGSHGGQSQIVQRPDRLGRQPQRPHRQFGQDARQPVGPSVGRNHDRTERRRLRRPLCRSHRMRHRQADLQAPAGHRAVQSVNQVPFSAEVVTHMSHIGQEAFGRELVARHAGWRRFHTDDGSELLRPYGKTFQRSAVLGRIVRPYPGRFGQQTFRLGQRHASPYAARPRCRRSRRHHAAAPGFHAIEQMIGPWQRRSPPLPCPTGEAAAEHPPSAPRPCRFPWLLFHQATFRYALHEASSHSNVQARKTISTAGASDSPGHAPGTRKAVTRQRRVPNESSGRDGIGSTRQRTAAQHGCRNEDSGRTSIPNPRPASQANCNRRYQRKGSRGTQPQTTGKTPDRNASSHAHHASCSLEGLTHSNASSDTPHAAAAGG